jgi:endonuclease/exonuclease/phosphatase (EEP) superfamily protein YafD
VGATLSDIRDQMLRAISSWAAEREGPRVVVGDLNATPWSVAMREILAEGPLRSTQRFGLQATWPSWLGPLGLPIDHVLVAGPLEPVARSIEPAFGSDHRMLVVDLELR